VIVADCAPARPQASASEIERAMRVFVFIGFSLGLGGWRGHITHLR
jgi:hypothetical protein